MSFNLLCVRFHFVSFKGIQISSKDQADVILEKRLIYDGFDKKEKNISSWSYALKLRRSIAITFYLCNRFYILTKSFHPLITLNKKQWINKYQFDLFKRFDLVIDLCDQKYKLNLFNKIKLYIIIGNLLFILGALRIVLP